MGVIEGHQIRVEVRPAVGGVIQGYQRRAEVRAALICWESQKVINVVLKAAVDGSDRRLPRSC